MKKKTPQRMMQETRRILILKFSDTDLSSEELESPVKSQKIRKSVNRSQLKPTKRKKKKDITKYIDPSKSTSEIGKKIPFPVESTIILKLISIEEKKHGNLTKDIKNDSNLVNSIFVKPSNTKDKKRAWDKCHVCVFCQNRFSKLS